MSAVKGYSVKVPTANGVTGRICVVTLAMSGDIDLLDINDCLSRFMRLIARHAIVATTCKDKYS